VDERKSALVGVLPSVLVVTLNWNSWEATLTLLESVLQVDYPNLCLLVIDNGSEDGSVEHLRTIRDDRVELLAFPENRGFTGGCNEGFKRALATGAHYVWLLNNDVVVEDKNTLSSLIALAESDPRIGMVSPRHIDFGKDGRLTYCGGVCSMDPLFCDKTGDPEQAERWTREYPNAGFVSGAAMLVKTSVIRKIGLLDEKFFAYFESVDYSYRSSLAGYRNLVDHNSMIRHPMKDQELNPSAIKEYWWYYQARNQCLLWRKHLGLARALRPCWWSLNGLLRRLRQMENQGAYDACLAGFWHGLINRGGQYRPEFRMPRLLAATIRQFARARTGHLQRVRRKVLVLDADSAAGLETVQSLGRDGCTVHAVSTRPERSRHRSRFISRQIEMAAYDDGGIRELVDLFRTENYDLIVPATEVSLLAMLSPEIPDNMYRRAVLASRTSVQTALDKQEVWSLARRVGVRVPSSEMVSSSSLPPEAFPVVLKPVFSKMNASGVVQEFSVTIARALTQWRMALELTYPGIPVQQQQYIPGRGLGVEMLFEHGTLRWAFLHERVHELPLTGGGSSYRVSLDLRDDLVQSATSLLSALHWHGVGMVEFRVTPGGEAYLMEINPRLWGSLALAIDCGVNFPAGLLCLSTGQPLSPQPKYRTGYFTRNIYRDIEWFKTNLKADHSDHLLLTKPIISSALEWLRPLAGRESWDFFNWSDLGVVLGELKTLVKEHWNRGVKAVKRRILRLYLRHIQQPKMLRKLRGRQTSKVLVICYGNICRSSLGAALGARRFPNASFSSAGFYPAVGRQSPGFVLAAAELFGVDLTEHRSKCVDSMLVDDAQLVLIMDIRDYGLLKDAYPRALEKTLLLGMLLPKPQLEIKDPYDDPDLMASISSQIGCAVERLGRFLR
jgi:hypothetical protein